MFLYVSNLGHDTKLCHFQKTTPKIMLNKMYFKLKKVFLDNSKLDFF